MTLIVRTAAPTDDLTRLWPKAGSLKLNLEQVIVAVDADADDALLGGLLVFHGGHEIAYVGEFTLTPGPGQRRVARQLVHHALIWCRRAGITLLTFHAIEPRWVSIVQRAGAVSIGAMLFFAVQIQSRESV